MSVVVGAPTTDSAGVDVGSAYLFDLQTSGGPEMPELQAGDANHDHSIDQIDLVQVQISAKYHTGQPATRGEGDWNGAPGGTPAEPPAGDGLFDQRDIVAGLTGGSYLTGPYAASGFRNNLIRTFHHV